MPSPSAPKKATATCAKSGGGVSRVFSATILALLLAACAGQPASQKAARTPTMVDQNAIASVLRAGFGEIRDKGLVEVSTAELFLAGLKTMNQFDPSLHLEVRDDLLTLSRLDQPIAQHQQPQADDMQGWIVATVAMFDHAKKMSPMIKVVDNDAFFQLMFDGALSKIDTYSRYSSGRNARANRASRNGFIGIGIDYDMVPGGAIIRSLVADGPAANAGLQVDDMISAADNKSLLGLTREGARRIIAGPPDSTVKLSVFRTGEARVLVMPVKRTLIVPDTVDASITEGVVIVKVDSFNVRTSADVSEAITDAKAKLDGKLKGVVLDLRGDPGGLLDQAVDLSDLFLDGGTIATLNGRHPGAKQFYAARPGDIADGKPMVVLVDGKSASSSEITAAALADNGRAVIVGTNTLGKGSVQTLIRLPNDGEIALTWAEVLSPGGYRFHGLGLLPSICTSEATTSLASLTEHVYRREAPWRALPDAWRTTERGTEATAKLRKLCPGQPRADQDLDLALAMRLATDRALYAQASSASLASSR